MQESQSYVHAGAALEAARNEWGGLGSSSREPPGSGEAAGISVSANGGVPCAWCLA